jgi:hypothetical protein
VKSVLGKTHGKTRQGPVVAATKPTLSSTAPGSVADHAGFVIFIFASRSFK